MSFWSVVCVHVCVLGSLCLCVCESYPCLPVSVSGSLYVYLGTLGGGMFDVCYLLPLGLNFHKWKHMCVPERVYV